MASARVNIGSTTGKHAGNTLSTRVGRNRAAKARLHRRARRDLGFYWLSLPFVGFWARSGLAFLGFSEQLTLAFLGFLREPPWLSLAFSMRRIRMRSSASDRVAPSLARRGRQPTSRQTLDVHVQTARGIMPNGQASRPNLGRRLTRTQLEHCQAHYVCRSHLG